MNCQLAQHDSAYVLGALGPADHREFEAHLPGCAECSEAVRDLAGIPGLLARVDPGDLTRLEADLPAPPDSVLPTLIATAHRDRSRRRMVIAAVAAAAAILVGGVGFALGNRGGEPPAAVVASVQRDLAPVGASDVTAKVALADAPWGTRLDLTCSYADAADPHEYEEPHAEPSYALYVLTRSGNEEQVASWHALHGKTMKLSAATSTSQADIAALQIRAADGTVVLATTD